MPKTISRNGAYDLDRSSIDYDAVKDPGHGNTAAAWTGVFIILIGAIVGCTGVVTGTSMLFWAGLIICAIGPIVGLVMRAAGKGGKKTKAKA
ncbi:HGxxPAAW family protein [Brevibacterium luteolum]|uniref:Uncharacterized protein n=1 Tax=Brevibacterium luteolum TaxID=199591 RepID=A0A6G8KU63_9MICO|nr:HGxxPAAW family protein [Brevibacterium luteolum]QIN28329.1 hypothetical protein EW640_02835 [Brevibacterium luteolum]